MNKIQEFFSEQFGTVRTVNVNGQVYFVGIDIAKALGYSNVAKAVSTHCNNCGSRNIGTRKEGCKYMLGNGLCGKNPTCTSSGECEAPCSYYDK